MTTYCGTCKKVIEGHNNKEVEVNFRKHVIFYHPEELYQKGGNYQ